jgi:biotin transport system substrate-specific component
MLNATLIIFESNNLDALAKFLISTVCLSVIGPLSIPTGDVPITLQSMLVLFFPLIFGWRIGFTSVLAYLVVGGLGLPVLSGYSSGFDKFSGPTGGFLFGFLAAALICGYLAEQVKKREALNFLLLIVLGHIIILLMGFGWLWTVRPFPEDWQAVVGQLLPGLAIKCAAGVLLFQLLLRAATPKDEYYKRSK